MERITEQNAEGRRPNPKARRPKGSKNVGWRVRKLGSGCYQGVVRVPGGKEETKVHATSAEAGQWARRRHAGLVTGQALARRLGETTAGLAQDYLSSLRARSRSDGHLARLQQFFDGLAKAVPDLAAPTAGREIDRWLNDMRSQRSDGPLSPAIRPTAPRCGAPLSLLQCLQLIPQAPVLDK